MDKLQRRYELFVQKNYRNAAVIGATLGVNPNQRVPNTNDFVKISLPLTITFDIQRNNYARPNNASIRIINLNEQTRLQILHDSTDFDQAQQVILRAGYGFDINTMPVIFAGYVKSCLSTRQGNEWVTEIEAFDGGWAYVNAHVDIAVKAGTPIVTIIGQILDAASEWGVRPNTIGNFEGVIPFDTSYSGNPFDIISELVGQYVFVDLNKVNVMKNGEYIYQDKIPVFNSSSGLIGTPIRRDQEFIFDVILSPNVLVGTAIRIESITPFNGIAFVASVKHHGTISGAVAGEAITTIGVKYGQTLIPLSPR